MSSGGCGSNNNRSKGHGGSGQGYNCKYQNSSNNKKSGGSNNNGSSERKKLSEPYYAGKHQADTSDSGKEQLILQIQKTFEHVFPPLLHDRLL